MIIRQDYRYREKNSFLQLNIKAPIEKYEYFKEANI